MLHRSTVPTGLQDVMGVEHHTCHDDSKKP